MTKETCKIYRINKDTEYTLCYALDEKEMKCIEEDNECYFENMANGRGYDECRKKRYECLKNSNYKDRDRFKL